VPVWRTIIRIVLSITRDNFDKEDVRNYQIYELGRKNKETCLLELFALPSPSLNDWIYKEHSQLDFLRDRPTYEAYCLENRINHLKDRIIQYQPQAVVFYGKGFEYSWRKITEKITDTEFLPTQEGFLICKSSPTVFVIAKHPVCPGVSNQYFDSIGKSIAANLNKN
jgi:hypothetical protein